MLTERKTWYGISENEMFALASILFFIMPHVIMSLKLGPQFGKCSTPRALLGINTSDILKTTLQQKAGPFHDSCASHVL
jgi:hypothetical protein